MKKLAIAVALCLSLFGSPVQAKTFVGVLWPMFGPLPAIGLVELVSELKMMLRGVTSDRLLIELTPAEREVLRQKFIQPCKVSCRRA